MISVGHANYIGRKKETARKTKRRMDDETTNVLAGQLNLGK